MKPAISSSHNNKTKDIPLLKEQQDNFLSSIVHHHDNDDDHEHLWSFCSNIYYTGNGSFEMMSSSSDSQNGNFNVCAQMTGVGRLVCRTLQQQVSTTTNGIVMEETWLTLLDLRRVGSLGDGGVVDISTVLAAVLITVVVEITLWFRNEWVRRLTIVIMMRCLQQQPSDAASI
jgi:hypothetical protein